MLRRARGLLLPSLLLALLAVPMVSAVAGPMPDRREMAELSAASADPARASAAVTRLRQIIASTDTVYIAGVRQVLLRALIVSGATAQEIVASTDSLRLLPLDLNANVLVHAQVAQTLLERRGELERAYEYGSHALKLVPRNVENQSVYASVQSLIGEIQLMRGNAAEAARLFEEVIPFAPDSQTVLSRLGNAYEKLGQMDRAIETYIRSVSVFGVRDTSAATPLRALYRKRHGNLRGLTERIDKAKQASMHAIALDGRRGDGAAPPWKLPDLDGKIVDSASFEGKILVVDFWGSWCGPCRAELPIFQEMYERYKDRGVAFVGINWEKGKTEEERIRAAKNFLAGYEFTFPVVFDHERAAVDAYQLEGFPTVYLIDQKGRIRYRNVGFSQNIDEIMAAQIESMLKQP